MDRHPFTDAAAATSADCLLASTLYLMGRHAAAPCARLAALIERHLVAVSNHPGCGALVREMSRRAARDMATEEGGCPLGYDRPPCAGTG